MINIAKKEKEVLILDSYKQTDKFQIDADREKEIIERARPLEKPAESLIKYFRENDRHATAIVNIPTTLLRYRSENGRISRDVLSKKNQPNNIGFFDGNTDAEQKFLEERLLNKDKKSNETLYNDIFGGEQREAAVITCDGLVIDGNRRLAIINKLNRETHQERFQTLKCMILPGHSKNNQDGNNIRNDAGGPPTNEEIAKLEIRYQMSKEAKSDYSEFDTALAHRRYRIENNISYKEQILMDTSYVKSKDREINKAVKEFEKAEKCLDQVDEYLNMIGQDKIYDLIEDGNKDVVSWASFTYFYNKVWSKIETDEDCIKENINEDLRSDIQKSCFLFMREGGLGMDGRLYKKMDYFLKFWKNEKCKNLITTKIIPIDPHLKPEEIEDINDFKEIDEMWKDKNKTTIITTFKTCKGIVDKKDDATSPLDYLEAALEKLEKAKIENLRGEDCDKAKELCHEIQELAKEKWNEAKNSKKKKKKLLDTHPYRSNSK